MGGSNETSVTEFILVGLSDHPWAQAIFFWLLLVVYLMMLVGNGLLVLLIQRNTHLHTPMYFFLSNLSVLDISYTSSTVPQALAHCYAHRPTISFVRCFAQMCISLFLGVTECLLLAAMAYDRFVAICQPLRYPLIMSWKVCVQLAATAWLSAFLLTFIPNMTLKDLFCGPNVINHFTCEVRAMLKLACSPNHVHEGIMFTSGVLTLLVPFAFILVTYIRIGLAVLRIRSTEGRNKAFSTCASHLAVVTIFYGTAMSMYLQPPSTSSSDQDKLIAVFYGVVTPMLNPLIYSLRNKDVKEALRRMSGRKIPP